MTTKWNWQQIVVPGVEQLNLPKFKKSVLLVEKRDGKFYGVVGSLETLDIDGPHWSTNTDFIGQIFGGMFTTKPLKNSDQFKPSYWCTIELPEEDENPETK